jgi:benzodiazapine receptor
MSHSIRLTRERSQGGLVGLGFAALSYAAGALGAATVRGARRPGWWFRVLRKSPVQPPDRLFGPVWTALYAAIAYSAWRVWRAPASPERTRALALGSAQLALNAAWTPLFFGAHRPRAALVDLIALDAAATAYAAAAAKVDRTAAALVAPYLAWLGFATHLNASIVARNPRILAR